MKEKSKFYVNYAVLFEWEWEWYSLYILIRYPAQTNIKHLSYNKQPQLGCVNTSRVRPFLLCLHQQNGWK